MDRIIADPPRKRGASQSLEELKASVARDLQQLLNTRATWRMCEARHVNIAKSLFTYGLPDFSGVDWGNYDARTELESLIEATIEHHEPRLQDVDVSYLRNTNDELDRTLRFKIGAKLRVHPAPEPVAFEAEHESTYAQFHIRRSGDDEK